MSDWSAAEPPRGRRQAGRYDYYGDNRARGNAAGAGRGRPPQPPPGGGRGNQPPARPPVRTRRKRRWPRRLAIALVALLVLLGAGVFYVDSTLQRTDALAFDDRVEDTPGTNWLIVGSDSREGLDDTQRDDLSAGDAGGRRTDSMMLVHVPSGGGQPSMISLPRDSSVSIPGYGRDKLNAAFSYGGPQLLGQTVEQATGVHIDHYAEIGFGGFAELVDAVGGVDVQLDAPMNDDMANVHLPAGPNTLDGATALSFVRARYSLEGGDLERAENQRMVMGALVDKATSPATLLNPFRMVPLVNGAGQTFLLDDGDHVWHLGSLALALGEISRGEGVTTSVPFGGFGYTDSGQSVVEWDSENALRMFDAIAADEPVPPDLVEP
ncbi:LCP family protein [Saccharopolyspora sp. HNM0983]|uniref:LCP family protein n=1 Tax=Saccharopolyspora montiporae TaxID=2781240 RepID=A0A929B8W9_9PSEU|nr:LCP family protein [Saccharopolyspora sp. HNM0983]MBE9373571.1 LCP family protein [Saccharopolyspora sp. HNM0983]